MTIKWEDGDTAPAETFSVLALATLISSSRTLGWSTDADQVKQDLADMQAFIFGEDNQTNNSYSDIVSNVDYAGLPQFKGKQARHYSQDRYFYEMLSKTTPKDTVTFRQMALLMMFGLIT